VVSSDGSVYHDCLNFVALSGQDGGQSGQLRARSRVLKRLMFKTFQIKAAGALIVLAFAGSTAAAAQPGNEGARWRDIATQRDRGRIREWRGAWTQALGQARRAYGAEIAAAGPLLEPDAALTQPVPPPGAYRCRTLKLGAQRPGLLDWVAYPWFACRVDPDGNSLRLTRLGGSQRPVGRLYSAGLRRMIFLGSLQLGDERQVLPYGADTDRDLAGILERVGERRWRLVFPRPTFESILDVIELVPA
jgi:hypothetical protein